MTSPVDLSRLAVERPTAGAALVVKRSAWLTRCAIPLTIIFGYSGVAGWLARELWLPAQPVTVVSVYVTKAEVQDAGTPLFQAAGWIEPRPTAVMCSSFVEGVVDELLVVEGQEVKVDEAVARLVDTDAKLNLREAESTVQLRVAERDAAQAVLTAARQNVDQPVQLQAAHADAEAALATLETEIKNLPFLIRSAEARLRLARQDLEAKTQIVDAIAGRSLQRSQSEFDTAQAELADLQQRVPNLARQHEAWQRKCDALHTRLTLKTDEIRALDEAQANLAAAEARLVQAQLSVETAKLRLDRMVVRSPINGRVLSLNARPGRRLMGISSAAELDASTVVTLYDPKMLQVRADVRLEDIPQVQIGQPVQIATAASGDQLVGHVLAMTSQADIQKNTLQVKVTIDQPSEVIRPEMLAQVIFLAPQRPESKPQGDSDPLRLLIAKELIEQAEAGDFVWVADRITNTARKQQIQIGKASKDDLVEVKQGLNALDKLIVNGRENLTDGVRIRIIGIDQRLGIAAKTTVMN